MEKAYDTTWRYGILKDLHNFDLKGRLPNFIKSFLEDRTIQVRVGSTLSDLYDQEQGVPQGAILSTTLFNVKLHDIINCLDYKTDGSSYVDDFCIRFRSKNMRTIERHLTAISEQNRRLGNKKWLQIFQIKNSVRSFLSTTENTQ